MSTAKLVLREHVETLYADHHGWLAGWLGQLVQGGRPGAGQGQAVQSVLAGRLLCDKVMQD